MLWHGKNFRGFLNKAKEVIFNNTGTTLTSTNVEDAIKEVNSNLSVNRITPSTGQYVIVDNQIIFKYGKTVSVNIIWHPSSTLAGNSLLFGDLPIPAGNTGFYFNATHSTGANQCVINGADGGIYNDYQTFETGKIYCISITYISN